MNTRSGSGSALILSAVGVQSSLICRVQVVPTGAFRLVATFSLSAGRRWRLGGWAINYKFHSVAAPETLESQGSVSELVLAAIQWLSPTLHAAGAEYWVHVATNRVWRFLFPTVVRPNRLILPPDAR